MNLLIKNLLKKYYQLMNNFLPRTMFVLFFGPLGLYFISAKRDIINLCIDKNYLIKRKRNLKIVNMCFNTLLLDAKYLQAYEILIIRNKKFGLSDNEFRHLIVASFISGKKIDKLLFKSPRLQEFFKKISNVISKPLINVNSESILEFKEYDNYLLVRHLALDFARNGDFEKQLKLYTDISWGLDKKLSTQSAYILDASNWVGPVGHIVFLYFLCLLIEKKMIDKKPIKIINATEANVSNKAILKEFGNAISLSESNDSLKDINLDILMINHEKKLNTYYQIADLFYNECIKVNEFALCDSPLEGREIEVDFAGILENYFNVSRKELWFVTLHVRENGFRFDPLGLSGTMRDGDISDYIHLIDEIVLRGGYVIRCGDKSMQPLNHTGVFDYARSDAKCSEMDVWLIKNTKLHIGTNSGFSYMPLLFAKPIIFTNDFPLMAHIGNKNCLSLPKRIFSLKTKKYLTIREMVDVDKVGDFGDHRVLMANNLRVEKNSSEMLKKCIIRILDESKKDKNMNIITNLSEFGTMNTLYPSLRTNFKIAIADEYFEVE